MSLPELLALVRDELDAQKIKVRFQDTVRGVIVSADDYASEVIGKAELRRRGVIVIEK